MDELIVNNVSFAYKDDNVIENFSYTANVNHFFHRYGKQFFQEYGKEFFLTYGKQNFQG